MLVNPKKSQNLQYKLEVIHQVISRDMSRLVIVCLFRSGSVRSLGLL